MRPDCDGCQGEGGSKGRLNCAICGGTGIAPVAMLLWCPMCHLRHVDAGAFATKNHHTHACQGCGHVWRPAIVATVGVQFLPGFKDLP